MGDVVYDRNGLAVISREEALELLTTRSVGRVSVTMRALPTILPINYVIDREQDAVVFRTGSGTKLYAATRGAVVAFEVDDIDPETRTGWSVVVIGSAMEVDDPSELARIDALGLDPWVTSARLHHTIKIPIVHLAGRRLLSSRPEPTLMTVSDDATVVDDLASGQRSLR